MIGLDPCGRRWATWTRRRSSTAARSGFAAHSGVLLPGENPRHDAAAAGGRAAGAVRASRVGRPAAGGHAAGGDRHSRASKFRIERAGHRGGLCPPWEAGAGERVSPRPSPEPGVRFAFLADPEGNLVELGNGVRPVSSTTRTSPRRRTGASSTPASRPRQPVAVAQPETPGDVAEAVRLARRERLDRLRALAAATAGPGGACARARADRPRVSARDDARRGDRHRRRRRSRAARS